MSDDIVKALLESLSPDQKAQLVAKLTKATTEKSVETTEEAVSSPERQDVAEDFTVTRENHKNRKTPVKANKNQWVDDGELGNDIDFDYQKFEKMKTPRRRGQPKKKKVECHVCGKSFTLNANLISGEFVRCNKCTGR